MLLDAFVATFAPFACLSCEQKGFLLCPSCQETSIAHLPSRCYRCHKATRQSTVCEGCRKLVNLTHVWTVTPYEGLTKELLELVKFERAGAGAKDIGRIMASALPILPSDTVVVHIPTAPKRVRIRGYDQAKLIAMAIAKLKKLNHQTALLRISSSRQVGSGRKERFIQAERSFRVKNAELVKNKQVLLVDDVTTSGATLESTANILKKAGAVSIDAIVFAQAMD